MCKVCKNINCKYLNYIVFVIFSNFIKITYNKKKQHVLKIAYNRLYYYELLIFYLH